MRTAIIISDLLQKGYENRKSTAQLIDETGLSERGIRRAVHRERLSGKIIISDCGGGYWLARTREELDRFARLQAKRARCSFATSKSARQALRECEGQETFFNGTEKGY